MLIESQYMAILNQLSVRMPALGLRPEKTLMAFANDLQAERINIDDLTLACRNWKNYRDKFPTYHELMKEIWKQKGIREKKAFAVDGNACPHDICSGIGYVGLQLNREFKMASCTCPNGQKQNKIMAPFTRLLKEGWKIDENDPYHRMAETGEVRSGVLEANKMMEN